MAERSRSAGSRRASSRLARQATLVAIALSVVAHAGLLATLAAMLTHARHLAAIRPQYLVAAMLPPEREPPPLIIPLAVPSPLPDGTPLLPATVDQPAYVPNPPKIEAPLVGGAITPYSPPAAQRSLPFAPAAVTQPTNLPVGGGLAGRKAAARAQLVAERGGSPQSEAAVERGLAWLVLHQSADGGWRFNHQHGECACRNPGQHESTTAATALALLPLLGAGHTPHEGLHQQSVVRGLAYLRGRMQNTPAGGDLQEGTMYAQGLATIALCEALALSGDDALRADAQQALNFIVTSQHLAGGWRYFPHQPGDTTVLGWQWMALKSGRMAGLAVPDETFARAAEFLDKVQSEGGAAYGYQGPGCEPTPTAVGLLCRMYSGVRRSDVRIVGGCELLAAWGPKFDDMYFNYYATQVLHHAEAPAWTAWNERLRNHLIATQATRGHEAGSWHFADYHTSAGGRLCDTALSLMILEVYYRHLPLYGWKSVEF
jgi:hypothetical protein